MARQARLDFPGALHHIITRGMDKRDIFKNDEDRANFLKRMGSVFEESATTCYAFSLMNNHIHLLLVTGVKPLSKVMQSLLTGHAVYFNNKHNRVGKLYQNRYKSILCDKDDYLLELVRYIHLNPLRAGMVNSLKALERYPWCSHSLYLGKHKQDWFDIDGILGEFADTYRKARNGYNAFIAEGMRLEPVDYEGGGLIRSLGGVWETEKARKDKSRRREGADERILGSGEFVDYAIQVSNEEESARSSLEREGWDTGRVLAFTASQFNIESEALLQRSRGNDIACARKLACKWMVVDLGMSQIEAAKVFGISRQGISKMVKGGREVEKDTGLKLGEER